MADTRKQTAEAAPEVSRPECGIVMPISEIDNCPAAHWAEVLTIITDALMAAGFSTQLVSNNGSSPVIQKRIVQNLYFSDLIVCDVSGKNSNVMLELGMRLAFDKPVILFKDDKTTYSFDISPIEHLSYPRDLRFGAIIDFKNKLSEKAQDLYNESKKADYQGGYLKSFGDFKVAQIAKTEVPQDAIIIEELESLRQIVENIAPRVLVIIPSGFDTISMEVRGLGIDELRRLARIVRSLPGVEASSSDVLNDGRNVIRAEVKPGSIMNADMLEGVVKMFMGARSKDSTELKNLILEQIYKPGKI